MLVDSHKHPFQVYACRSQKGWIFLLAQMTQMMWLGEHKCGKGMSSTAVAAHCGRSLYGEESDDL